MSAEFFAQHIQCSRKDKEECLHVIPALSAVAFSAQGGVRALEELMDDPSWAGDTTPFLRKAVQLYMDAKNADQIRDVLWNTILSSGLSGPQFLEAALTTEVIAALFRREDDLNYIFEYLAASFFGIEYESLAAERYRAYRREWFAQGEHVPEATAPDGPGRAGGADANRDA